MKSEASTANAPVPVPVPAPAPTPASAMQQSHQPSHHPPSPPIQPDPMLTSPSISPPISPSTTSTSSSVPASPTLCLSPPLPPSKQLPPAIASVSPTSASPAPASPTLDSPAPVSPTPASPTSPSPTPTSPTPASPTPASPPPPSSPTPRASSPPRDPPPPQPSPPAPSTPPASPTTRAPSPPPNPSPPQPALPAPPTSPTTASTPSEPATPPVSRKLSLSPSPVPYPSSPTPTTTAELRSALATAIAERDAALIQAAASPAAQCSACPTLQAQLDRLERRNASLRMQLKTSIQTTRTHGQRLLRAAFQQRVAELQHEHAEKTTSMLNLQKKCFEDELTAMEAQAGAALDALHGQLRAERAARLADANAASELRDTALRKTADTLQAVQRKMALLHARATRLERERRAAATAAAERQAVVEVLAAAAAARDVERRRVDLLASVHDEERARKNSLIDGLQSELSAVREQLVRERELSAALVEKVEHMEGVRQEDSLRHAEIVDDCKQASKKEIDGLGLLFASVIQDIATGHTDVSMGD